MLNLNYLESNFALAWIPGPWELVLILAVVLILFGGKKLPELARGLGKGLREFKSAMHSVKSEVDDLTDQITQVDDGQDAKSDSAVQSEDDNNTTTSGESKSV